MVSAINIESISQVHEMTCQRRPAHPLISVIGASWQPPLQIPAGIVSARITTSLYSISLKRGDECGFKYGRHHYDFQAGSVMFLGPGQSMVPIADARELEEEGDGWTLMFHPDLIRKSPLATKMNEYSFFGYESHEALHLSDQEQAILTAEVKRIEDEYSRGSDQHSQELLVSHVHLLLTYCQRFYGRQFSLRSNANKDVISRLETFLQQYFESDKPANDGLPSVQGCAKAMGYSPDYLSDLLKKETGKNTREHIHHFLIERAKTRLLGSEDSISEIAYSLGFEHPQHFSKLFRSKTGMSPGEYRN
jgi:AraC family transcriptional regulator, transcriptional activator of pobA